MSITFQRALIYAWWETVQTTLSCFCKLHMDQFTRVSNTAFGQLQKEKQDGQGNHSEECATRNDWMCLEGVPEAQDQDSSRFSVPFSAQSQQEHYGAVGHPFGQF